MTLKSDAASKLYAILRDDDGRGRLPVRGCAGGPGLRVRAVYLGGGDRVWACFCDGDPELRRERRPLNMIEVTTIERSNDLGDKHIVRCYSDRKTILTYEESKGERR